jgi:DNA topoisomerase III
MGKALIITEKPSVARDITNALGGFSSKQGGDFFESDDFICSYAVGHLFTLLEPHDIDPRFKRWDIRMLPIIPDDFRLKPVPKMNKRIAVLKKLLGRSDVTCVINACDAAREGELIFREIVEFCESEKPIKRLWLQSMTSAAIAKGFKNLKEGKSYEGLGQAASCRARSDWLIGMNATRAMSKRMQTKKDTKPWSVGRVQTPTLALLVERELEILGHVPEDYFKVKAVFKASDHSYEATWFDPKFAENELNPQHKDDRIFNSATADSIVSDVLGKPGVAAEKREESKRNAPPLFSLTSLQKTMSSRYKWNSQRTLKAAQRCYEQHKVLTYPRTSSTCLPNDYRGEVSRVLDILAGTDWYGEYAQYLIKNGLKNTKRTFNDAGVTDHFAIIPTGSMKGLSGDDAKLFDVVIKRFLACFYPASIYDKVRRSTQVSEHYFRTGPIETMSLAGWQAVYGKAPGKDSKEEHLPPLKAGALQAVGVPVKNIDAETKGFETKPPPRISESRLLSLMEFAGRHVDDEELASILMSAEGLGTAATRADIIQNLKTKEYVDDNLRPFNKGIRLIETLKRLDRSLMTSAKLTAGLERQLHQVEDSERTELKYMGNIKQFTREVVESIQEMNWALLYPNEDSLGKCPKCGGQVYERGLFYGCETVKWPEPGCGMQFWKECYGRYLDRNSVRVILEKGESHPLEGFRDVKGKAYNAALKLDGINLTRLAVNGEELPKASASPSMDIEDDTEVDATPIVPCPIHKGKCQVIETKGAYVCQTRREKFVAGDKSAKGILVPRMVCKRTITREEVKAYATDGRTPVLEKFISKKGKPFSALLVMTPNGSFTFEFPPREGASFDGSNSGEARGTKNYKKTLNRKKTRSKKATSTKEF